MSRVLKVIFCRTGSRMGGAPRWPAFAVMGVCFVGGACVRRRFVCVDGVRILWLLHERALSVMFLWMGRV